MFKGSSSNIDELTDVVNSWSSYCENIVIPVKTVKVFPNSKPWASKSLKLLLSRKKKAFREGNPLLMRALQKEIKHAIWIGKKKYKEKIETQLQMNNLGSAWDSMKIITGTKKGDKRNIQLNGYKSDVLLAQSFNDFYGDQRWSAGSAPCRPLFR